MKEFLDFQVSFQEEESYKGKDGRPSNPVPKKVVEWERDFDRQGRCKKKETRKLEDYIEINIGTEEEPRKIKIGKGTSEKERKNLIELVKEFRDVFSFQYDELKAYRDDVFQHTIPLRPDSKPFRQKLRRIISSHGPTGVTENVGSRKFGKWKYH